MVRGRLLRRRPLAAAGAQGARAVRPGAGAGSRPGCLGAGRGRARVRAVRTGAGAVATVGGARPWPRPGAAHDPGGRGPSPGPGRRRTAAAVPARHPRRGGPGRSGRRAAPVQPRRCAAGGQAPRGRAGGSSGRRGRRHHHHRRHRRGGLPRCGRQAPSSAPWRWWRPRHGGCRRSEKWADGYHSAAQATSVCVWHPPGSVVAPKGLLARPLSASRCQPQAKRPT
jgi:hypothetical protein